MQHIIKKIVFFITMTGTLTASSLAYPQQEATSKVSVAPVQGAVEQPKVTFIETTPTIPFIETTPTIPFIETIDAYAGKQVTFPNNTIYVLKWMYSMQGGEKTSFWAQYNTEAETEVKKFSEFPFTTKEDSYSTNLRVIAELGKHGIKNW